MNDQDKTALVYQGKPIREDGEMLNLTDMWRAAGGDPSRKPAKWLETEQARDFIEFVESNLKVRNADLDLIRSERGGRAPATWAHWQIGMAYAKYLSPEFHVWCNEVVRAHMEGRLVPVALGVAAGVMSMEQVRALASEIVTPIVDRMDRNFERSWGRQDQLEEKVDDTSKRLTDVERKVALLANAKRRELTKATKEEHCDATYRMGGRCPCCSVEPVVDANGERSFGAEFDHFYQNSRADTDHTWLICGRCHAELTHGVVRRGDREAEFSAYQSRRKRLPGRQAALFS